MIIPNDAGAYLQVTAVLVAVWAIVTQLQWAANRHHFAAGGLLHMRRPPHPLLRPWRRLMSPRGVVLVTVARLAAALVLLLASTPAGYAIGFALTLILAPTMTLGRAFPDGADKMGQIVAAGGLLGAAGLLLDDPLLGFSGVLLVGGQLTVSYVAAGVSKMFKPQWRNGQAIAAVMRSASYGHPLAAALLRHRALQFAFCWAFMLSEALFPLVLILPTPFAWIAMAMFVLFHILTGVFMGLSTFLWAFPAAYPALLLLSRATRSLLGT